MVKVFISWSGESSKSIAEILRRWFPSVIQAVKPYYTPDDISKGNRWSSEIARELDESRIGIICLTEDNLEKPWIMFEAGALSKNIERSKVCPILFGVEPSDIKGPLVQFQAASFSKSEMWKVLKMMNFELGEDSLSDESLNGSFEMWWPKLEEQVKAELAKPKDNHTEERPERDILEEVLALTRSISIDQNDGNFTGAQSAFYSSILSPLMSSFDNLRGDVAYLKREITKKETIAVFEPEPDISRELRELDARLDGQLVKEAIDGPFGIRWKLQIYRALTQMYENNPSSKSQYLAMQSLRNYIDRIESKLPQTQFKS